MTSPISVQTQIQIRQQASSLAEKLFFAPTPEALETALSLAESHPKTVSQTSLLSALLARTEGRNLANILDIMLTYNPELLAELGSLLKPDQARSLPPAALADFTTKHSNTGTTLSHTLSSLASTPVKSKIKAR